MTITTRSESTMSKRPRSVLALALVALAVVVAGCGGDDSSGGSSSGGGGGSASQPGKGKPAVTIGTKNFTEEFVLGELYAQALRAKGYTVNLKTNLGATEVADKALTSGRIDAYPEYTGVTVSVVAKDDTLPKSAADTASKAKAFYEQRGETTSQPTPFQDTDTLATLKDFAAKNKLESVADLKKLPGIKLGAPAEFRSRLNGLRGMKQVYGVDDVSFKPLAIGLQYPALDKGSVKVANVFSTDPQLASGKYQLLKDPKGVFGYQNVLFVIDKKKYDALGGTTFMGIINGVNKLLTGKAMQTMNAAVDLNKQEPAAVAKQFLQANNLA